MSLQDEERGHMRIQTEFEEHLSKYQTLSRTHQLAHIQAFNRFAKAQTREVHGQWSDDTFINKRLYRQRKSEGSGNAPTKCVL